jgi:arsenate reductase-like glutaredoxin family protein
MLNWHSSKSATWAAKKKNNPGNGVIFLTGNELEDNVKTNARQAAGRAKPETDKKKDSVKSVLEKSPSLKATLNKINTIQKGNDPLDQNKGNKEEIQTDKEPLEPLTKEKLLEQYEVYISRLSNTQPRLYSALKSKIPEIVTQTKISLSFQNKAILQEFISRIRPGLISFLREALKNPYLEIAEVLAEINDVEKPSLVSDNERLQTMIEKNPVLSKLKNMFNLDFD